MNNPEQPSSRYREITANYTLELRTTLATAAFDALEASRHDRLSEDETRVIVELNIDYAIATNYIDGKAAPLPPRRERLRQNLLNRGPQGFVQVKTQAAPYFPTK